MTSVSQLNKSLSRHAALLERMWEGQEDRITEDNARAVTELRALQIVISDDEGNIRLARTYRELLERSIGRRGNYAASRSISEDIDRLRAAAREAEDAAFRQDDHAHASATQEGSDIIWELVDTLETVVTDYERLLHDGLGVTGSREARMRRTQYAIDKLKALGQSLAFLVDGPVHETLAQPACRDLRREFSRLISDKLNFVVQRVARTANELNRMLLEDTEVLEETRRTRHMLRLLKAVGAQERVEAMMGMIDTRVQPFFRMDLLVDPLDAKTEDLREKLARSLQPVERKQMRVVETPGPLIDATTEYRPDDTDPDADLAEAFERDVESLGAISLRKWLSGRGRTDDDHAFEVIMSGVLSEPEVFDITFSPPLNPHKSSRIHDITVALAA